MWLCVVRPAGWVAFCLNTGLRLEVYDHEKAAAGNAEEAEAAVVEELRNEVIHKGELEVRMD